LWSVIRGCPKEQWFLPCWPTSTSTSWTKPLKRPGYRLVRFGDDFVVMAKTKERAAEAEEIVTEKLRTMGLVLNRDKTRLTSFNEGFEFLGALFCRTVVLNIDKDVSDNTKAVLDCLPPRSDLKEASGNTVDLSGWLQNLVEAQNLDPFVSKEEAPETRHFRPAVSPPSPERRPVNVVSRGAELTGRKRGLYVEQEGVAPRLVGWREISEIVVMGGRYIKSSVFQRAMANRIPIAFHKWDGTPAGLLLPDRVRSPSPLTLTQWRWRDNEEASLAVARQLVEAKIRNQRVFARRRAEDSNRLRRELRRLEGKAVAAGDTDTLRGYEGQAAHAYFSEWKQWLGNGFDDFEGRTARGAGDPVNAMLNLLYTNLFRATHTTILSVGLDPYLGVMHEGRGRYAALAADMMEPFRFLVDRVVIGMVNRGRITREDFQKNEKGPYKIRILSEPLKLLIGEFERQLAREVSDAGGPKDSFRGHLYRQVLSWGGLSMEKKSGSLPFG
jgi:CRISP-associated protein Cas1